MNAPSIVPSPSEQASSASSNDGSSSPFSQKWPVALFSTLAIATLGFGLVFLHLYHGALKEAALQPETIYGGPLPPSLTHPIAFKANGGSIAQMVHEPSNTKISIAISDPVQRRNASTVGDQSSLTEASVVEVLRAYQGVRATPERLTPLTTTFLTSHIDARRAVGLNSETIKVRNRELTVERFIGKNQENFLLTVINLKEANLGYRQVAILIMAISEAVPLQLAEELLREMPLLTSLDNRALDN